MHQRRQTAADDEQKHSRRTRLAAGERKTDGTRQNVGRNTVDGTR